MPLAVSRLLMRMMNDLHKQNRRGDAVPEEYRSSKPRFLFSYFTAGGEGAGSDVKSLRFESGRYVPLLFALSHLKADRSLLNCRDQISREISVNMQDFLCRDRAVESANKRHCIWTPAPGTSQTISPYAWRELEE